MNTNTIPELSYCFNTDVTSVHDYKNRIKLINNYFIKKNRNWKVFYRGDCYCAKTQSNFFRNCSLSCENKNYDEWEKSKHYSLKETDSEFIKLAKMQHYWGNTRLLDFSESELIALRFACGNKNGMCCTKKVTFYFTDFINYNDNCQQDKINTFMKLIKSGTSLRDFTDTEKEILTKDYFVKIPYETFEDSDFERIKRQKGLFLMMGNCESVHTSNGKKAKFANEKVKHELSPTVGRGREYEGYVGVLRISRYHIDEIRNELERTKEYNMKFLLAED